MEKMINKLLEKSKEAFLLAIEIYNKPTIKYRVEGFSFFICNAWELLLKARIIDKNGNDSIYFKDNMSRTISIENCIKKVFTNDKDPLRKNLEKILELRNTSTHFITEEYEMVYIPLFQACVFNYIEKLQSFFGDDVAESIQQSFITLCLTANDLNNDKIRTKYPKEISEKLINTYNEIHPIITENNSRFAVNINNYFYITKNPDKASITVSINKESENGIKIVKELKDPNETHKYTTKKCCTEINKRISAFSSVVFNAYHFSLFCKNYDLKNNPNFCYINTTFSSPQYSYSYQVIDFIVAEIKKDPDNIIQVLKNKLKKESST